MDVLVKVQQRFDKQKADKRRVLLKNKKKMTELQQEVELIYCAISIMKN